VLQKLLNRWFLSNCEMFPFWTKISVYKWLNIKRRRSTSRDADQHQETLTTRPTVSPLTIWISDLSLEVMDYPLDNTFDKFYDFDNRTWASHGLYLDYTLIWCCARE